MRSTAFWKALGTGAAAPAMLYAPEQDYMIYATIDTITKTETYEFTSVIVCSKADTIVKVTSNECKR